MGVGEPLRASPIPKTDPMGRPLGLWGADEVQQVDPRGRGASVAGESMVEDGPASTDAAAGLGATPGSEHLSSLREPYLQLLAAEGRFGYHRLRSTDGLADALRAPALARPLAAPAHARVALMALALLLLLAPYAVPRQATREDRRETVTFGRLCWPMPDFSAPCLGRAARYRVSAPARAGVPWRLCAHPWPTNCLRT